MDPEQQGAHFQYEEYRRFGQRAGAVVLLAVVVYTVGWGYLCYLMIPSTPRHWNFGERSHAPAVSVYTSVATPHPEHPPRQLERLPASDFPDQRQVEP